MRCSALTVLRDGSRVFFDDVLQDLVNQRQFSIHLLELAVLLLEFLEPADLTQLHAAVLALPIVQCRFRYAVIAGNCLGINAALKLLNGLHHLTLCVYFSFHRRKSNDFCLIQICPTNREGYMSNKYNYHDIIPDRSTPERSSSLACYLHVTNQPHLRMWLTHYL